jgi:hypothetical protein
MKKSGEPIPRLDSEHLSIDSPWCYDLALNIALPLPIMRVASW